MSTLMTRIPERTLAALTRYADEHIQTGGFLEAVLSNNLFEAIGRADEENNAALPAIVAYIYNNLPSGSWGNPERVHRWLETKGAE